MRTENTMKNLLIAFALAAAALTTGCATSSVAKAPADGGAKDEAKSINRYDDYDAAMAPVKGDPSAAEWQAANAAAVKKATSREALAALTKDEASMAALLAKVKGAYATNPFAATQIAAVTQMSMCPKCAKAQELRYCWTKALLAAARDAQDPYAKMFFIEQLRWCAFVAQASCVRKIGEASGDAKVAEFARFAAKEIESAR